MSPITVLKFEKKRNSSQNVKTKDKNVSDPAQDRTGDLLRVKQMW